MVCGLCQRECLRQPHRVIHVERRGLEIGPDAVRAQQLVNRADECVLPPRRGLVTGEMLEITESRDELWQGHRLDRAPLVRHGTAKMATRGFHLCEPVECVDVARPNRECTAVLAVSRCDAAL